MTRQDRFISICLIVMTLALLGTIGVGVYHIGWTNGFTECKQLYDGGSK